MSAHHLLDKIAAHPSLYDPTADEIPIIEFLHRQRLIDRHLKHDGTAGYHVTNVGFIYLRAKSK